MYFSIALTITHDALTTKRKSFMKLLIAECSANYSGRGDTTLERGVRAIIIKEDGSVSIHNDVGNKPLNYMKAPAMSETTNLMGERCLHFDARRESLTITLHQVLSEASHELISEDPGVVRDGTEKQLQEWLSENLQFVAPELTFVQREYNTGEGAVDLLAVDREGRAVAIEVKRSAMIPAADQVRRYVDALRTRDHLALGVNFSQAYGIVAAVDFRPSLVALAEKRKLRLLELPTYWRKADEAIETPHEDC